jgi:hypothetical protein
MERIGKQVADNPPAHIEVTQLRAVNDELVSALEECSRRLRTAVIAGGTDEEYADIAVERYVRLLALARPAAPVVLKDGDTQ